MQHTTQDNRTLDRFFELYKQKMPKAVYLMRNPQRYTKIQEVIETIKQLATIYDKKAKVICCPDELTGASMCVTVQTDMFVVDNIELFRQVISEADTFEICPLRNGKIEIGFAFEETWKAAPAFEHPFEELNKIQGE